jgi:hypothetical protein
VTILVTILNVQSHKKGGKPQQLAATLIRSQ